MPKEEGGKNSPTISAGGNVTIGHIGDVTINQASQPQLRLLDQKDYTQPDGTHATVFTIEIVAQLTPAFLAIDLIADGILNANILPPSVNGVSTIMLRNKRISSTGYHAELTSPRGRYIVTVQTKGQTPVKLTYQF
jgi:hypothetical protein